MNASPKIRFVYFDLGNILLAFDVEVACRNLAELLSVTPEHVRSAVYDSGLEDRFERGEFSSQQFAAEATAAIGVTGNPPPVESVIDAISDMFTPIKEMVGVMDRVGAGGRGVGILSNTCHGHWDWIRRQSYDVMRADLDAVVLSYAVGAMKPDARIYEAAERAANVPPSEILFIDDKQENVAAANARGWSSRQCLGGDQAIGVLESFGVI